MPGEILIGGGLALIGGKTLHSAFCIRSSLKRAVTWPTTEGRVTESRVIRNETGTWGAKVEYAYTIDGAQYASQIVNVDGTVNVGFTDKYAKRTVEEFPVGSTVIVHFDPDEPECSFLKTAPSSASTVRFVIGMTLLVVGVVVGLIEWL